MSAGYGKALYIHGEFPALISMTISSILGTSSGTVITRTMLSGRIEIQPRIPSALSSLYQRVCIADGALECTYRFRPDGTREYRYEWSGTAQVSLDVSVGTYAPFEVSMPRGSILHITCQGDMLNAVVYGTDGSVLQRASAIIDPCLLNLQESRDRFFQDIGFAAPSYRENIKSLSRYFDPPLDYQSVE